ncbi:site-specific integrase [Bradyrhizobium sp. 188]|uniref:site-specific integrase n=1 Tax=Bradyrhizobium sp. 188 TaxID=2782656 RepID=UPI001FFB2C6C|nr:site-specific integrase [Bradyrhizobium sp. 188]MCK1501480.1 tyrosine-type recombinase/integrase [Bradyrhizobium sp. 188]
MSESTALVDPMASVRAYLEAEKSNNTRRAYASDWCDFRTWCEGQNCSCLPAAPIDVARYLAQLADGGKKSSTIQRRTSAIAAAHKVGGHEPPTNFEGVKAVMRGIRRRLGKRKRKAAPATAELLGLAIAAIPATKRGLRDRALVLIGFAGAFRRSELVDIQVNSIERRPRGILVHVERSKTDQEGRGAALPIPNGKMRAVDALDIWLAAAAITEGPIFRSVDRHGNVGTGALTDRQVARIVKEVCGRVGMDPAIYSGHSLRAGFITSALEAKVDPLKVMQQSRHVKVDTLKEYDRRENDFDHHAGGDFL